MIKEPAICYIKNRLISVNFPSSYFYYYKGKFMFQRLSISTLVLSCGITGTLTTNFAMADSIHLKDGQTLTGTFVSRNAENVVFEIAGQQLKFKSENVSSVNFGPTEKLEPKKTPEVVVKKSPKPVVTQANNTAKAESITLAAGTRIVVRTTSALSSQKHATGHKFIARLEANLMVGEVVAIPRGATLYGVVSEAKKSGRLRGKASMKLAFTDVMINNQLIPIQTTEVKALTEETGKKTVGKTARAAAIGGLANGSDGAKTGAAIGLGLAILGGGSSINIPSGTMLEFQLSAPLQR
jgi:hypothetical protein